MATYLGIDIATVATVNVLLQTAAYLLLIRGFLFARKKNFRRHKMIMSIATSLNFISLAVVMLPSFYSIVSKISLPEMNSFSSIVVLHHLIGLSALILASLVVLRSCGSIIKNTKLLMITIFTLWSVGYFMGLTVYYLLYFPA